MGNYFTVEYGGDTITIIPGINFRLGSGMHLRFAQGTNVRAGPGILPAAQVIIAPMSLGAIQGIMPAMSHSIIQGIMPSMSVQVVQGIMPSMSVDAVQGIMPTMSHGAISEPATSIVTGNILEQPLAPLFPYYGGFLPGISPIQGYDLPGTVQLIRNRRYRISMPSKR